MTESAIIFRALWCMLGLCGPPDAVGVGAYYQEGLMRQVCEYRVAERWQPHLDCSWPCLVSAIEPEHLGEMWFVDLPGGSIHL